MNWSCFTPWETVFFRKGCQNQPNGMGTRQLQLVRVAYAELRHCRCGLMGASTFCACPRAREVRSLDNRRNKTYECWKIIGDGTLIVVITQHILTHMQVADEQNHLSPWANLDFRSFPNLLDTFIIGCSVVECATKNTRATQTRDWLFGCPLDALENNSHDDFANSLGWLQGSKKSMKKISLPGV